MAADIYGMLNTNAPAQIGQILSPQYIEQQRIAGLLNREKEAELNRGIKMREILSGTTDPAQASQRLLSIGMPEEAAKLQTVATNQAELQRRQAESMRKQRLESATQAAWLNPSDDAFIGVLTASGIPPEQHASALAALPTDPEKRRMMIGLTPEKQAELSYQSQKADAANKAAEARQNAQFEQQMKLQDRKDLASERQLNMRLAAQQGPGSVAKPPAGYRYTADGNMEAIPGGPADTKKIAAEEKAKASAQKALDFADQGITVIDQLIKDPGLGKITGFYSKMPIIPSTDMARADALAKQLEGQAFLQAFQSLKGGGAITNVEGEKASAAIARLNRAQSTKDYVDALKDLKSVMQSTKSRAESGAAYAPASRQIFKSKSGATIEALD